MEQRIKMTPRDFFLYVATMAALYVSAISLLALLFQYIDILFPSSLEFYRDPYSTSIRFAIASLLIIFPLYVFFTRLLNQDIRRHPEKKDLGVRKWVIYITLFVAGITLVGDLIVLINTFLGGELTTRFALKVLAVLVVIGGAFLYYFNDLRGLWERKENISKGIGALVVVAVLVAIVSGFFIIGSPQTQRELRFDQEKVNDLNNIQWQVLNYWQQTEDLPETLAELEDPLMGYQVPVDSQTGEPYAYRATGPLTFELCATFNLASSQRQRQESFPIEKGALEGNFTHDAGEECFERTIDPELFPPRSAR